MKIRGREIGFLRTVKTACDIADLCPDKSLVNFSALFSGTMADINKNGAKIICLMNEGYEMSRHFEDPSYEPHVLTVDEVLYLDDDTYQQLFSEMMAAFTGDRQTVETDEPKKNENVKTEE